MKRLIEVQEAGWSPSSKTLTSFTHAKKDIITSTKGKTKRSTKKQEEVAKRLSSNVGKERAEILKGMEDEEEGEGSFYDDSLFDMVEQLDDMDR